MLLKRRGATSAGTVPKGAAPQVVLQEKASEQPALQMATDQGASGRPILDGGAASPADNPDEKRRSDIAIRQSVAFAQIVSVMSRASTHKYFTFADIEWLVIPPLVTGQFAVAEAKPQGNGPALPVALAFWAHVSPAVDKRLSENLDAPLRLRPDEWQSGDILWLVDIVGDRRVLGGFLRQLGGTVWKGRAPKMRAKDAEGKLIVKQLTDGAEVTAVR
jgi:hemolysin-activating ACP:hemolysin acyltransferase